MIKVFIYSCLLLVFLINCKSNIPEARNKTDYSQITRLSVSFRYICLFFEHFRYYSFEYNLDNYTGTLR